MKEMRIITLCFICLLSFSCMSVEFKKTGEVYSPLSEDIEVQEFITSFPNQKYEEIGILSVEGGSEEERIEEAKEIARENGGDGVIAKSLQDNGDESDFDIEGNQIANSDVQEFIIVKLEENEPDDTGFMVDRDSGKRGGAIDFSTLPRATYKQLVDDSGSIQGEMFRGKLLPRKLYKIPSSLKEYTEDGDKIVLLSTKSGKYKILLIVPNSKIDILKKKIKSRKMIDFAYSPVTVFKTRKGKRPVIEFVAEVTR